MAKNEFAKLFKLIRRYQVLLWIGALLFVLCISAALLIYYFIDDKYSKQAFWFEVADFLMAVGQTMLGTVLIGGGLGGVFNYIVEEQKKEQEAVQERLKRMQESRDRRRVIRQKIRNRLQEVHDDVELARVLIKSHRSGRTYGEQIRDRIMPGNIALQDIKRQLLEMEDESPIQYIAELHVSLTFMSAYLSTLIEEYAHYYLDIAHIQNYQDTLAERRHNVFSELIESNNPAPISNVDHKRAFLEETQERLQNEPLPDRMDAVWEAMEELDYVWDFIADLRDEHGKASLYQNFFIDHHFHCFRLLRDRDSERNKRLCSRHNFTHYLQELERLSTKKISEHPITKHDSLTRMVMVDELQFDFETMGRKT